MPQDPNDEPASELLERIAVDALPANRRFGLLAGKLRVSGNFDDPLPDDILTDFEER
ncbi:MAG: hypothetical protein ABSC95_11580 [Acetobacteraceae bacterium]|jgi:hypothetical protein